MSINNKKEYIFSKPYEKQLRSRLQGKSLAFYIYSFEERKSVKTETGEIKGRITRIRVTISKSRLPRHCNPELVEQALAHLEANLEKISVTNNVLLLPENENYKLLEILGEYTKNDRFDLIGYKISIVAMFAMIPIMVICSLLMAIVLSSPPFQLAAIIYFGSFFTMLVSSALGIAMAVNEGALGVKFGRWIGDIIKGKNREPSNLQALDENLNQLMNQQENVPQEVIKIYPSLSLINNPGLTLQDTTANANDSSQQIPKNMPTMK